MRRLLSGPPVISTLDPANGHGGSHPLWLNFTWEVVDNSDHWPFLQQRIPAVLLHTGLHRDYHRPSDDAEKVNRQGMRDVARYLTALSIKAANEDQAIGVEIVRRAVEAPIKQISDNAGVDGAVVAQKVKESKEVNFGYNALTHEYGDMLKMGVIVPTKVERAALQNAASISGLLLTTDAVISEIKEDKPEPAGAPGGGMGGMY